MLVASIYGMEIKSYNGQLYLQEFTDCGLPKSVDYCKKFNTIQGALMYCTRKLKLSY